MTTVLQERFPTNIAYGLIGGPGFLTQRVETGGGTAYKNALWSQPLRRFQADTMNWTVAQAQTFIAFEHTVSFGQAYNFRVKDWTDYQATNAPIGTGDGATLVFQLSKTYLSPSGSIGFKRILTQINGGFAGDVQPQILVNGVIQSGANYSLNLATGVLTFGAGHAPPLGQAVTWTGEFDVPCEMGSDYQPVTYENFSMINAKSIILNEVRV